MLDINFVRENLEAVRAALVNRNSPADALDKFSELDAERRRVIIEADAQTRRSIFSATVAKDEFAPGAIRWQK